MNEIEYSIIIGVSGRRAVRGHQIGYYAVRSCRGETSVAGHGRYKGAASVSLDYTVDHIASGISIIDAGSYADAVAIADELSRFSPADDMVPSAEAVRDGFKCCDEYAAHIGPELRAWLASIPALQRFVPFREWRAALTRSA